MNSYIIRKSSRAKHLRLSVRNDGQVILTVPIRVNQKLAQKFLKDKEVWIKKSLGKLGDKKRLSPLRTVKEINLDKKKARRLVEDRAEYFSKLMKVKFNRVAIRDQKTRWGSCSQKGNLNFNYRIVYLPGSLADYLIVHELCHLKVMNHSPRYWKLVESIIPDYKERRKELKKYSLN